MRAQLPIEMILLRQVASYLTLPILLMDEEGSLLFYNEPAERLLGMTFEDAGTIRAHQLAGLFKATDLAGTPLKDSELPVVTALMTRKPAQGRLRFRGLDDQWHEVETTAVPIEGHGKRFLGVIAMFWGTAD